MEIPSKLIAELTKQLAVKGFQITHMDILLEGNIEILSIQLSKNGLSYTIGIAPYSLIEETNETFVSDIMFALEREEKIKCGSTYKWITGQSPHTTGSYLVSLKVGIVHSYVAHYNDLHKSWHMFDPLTGRVGANITGHVLGWADGISVLSE